MKLKQRINKKSVETSRMTLPNYQGSEKFVVKVTNSTNVYQVQDSILTHSSRLRFPNISRERERDKKIIK